MSAEQTKVVNLPASVPVGDMLANPALFEHMQRVAKMFMRSSLIPDHLKKNDGADAFLALQIARERGESPVAVMQNIYFVSGKAGWLTAYMIGRANKSGAFKGRIKWRTVGKAEQMEVTAFAIAADDGEECSATVSMAMAIGEGWARNPKYKTMQEHMLKWRAATMLIRLYCPEVMHGMMSADELEDMEAARAPRHVGSGSAAPPEPRRSDYVHDADLGDGADAAAGQDAAAEPAHDTETGEVLDQAATKKSWKLSGDIVGQQAKLGAIHDLLEMAEIKAEVDDIEAEHKEFIDKLGAMKKSETNKAFADRKAELPEKAAGLA